jgi:hypothetical protein
LARADATDLRDTGLPGIGYCYLEYTIWKGIENGCLLYGAHLLLTVIGMGVAVDKVRGLPGLDGAGKAVESTVTEILAVVTSGRRCMGQDNVRRAVSECLSLHAPNYSSHLSLSVLIPALVVALAPLESSQAYSW